MAKSPVLINRQPELDALCRQLRELDAPVAIDTEFISERRYQPKLCLVQVYAEADGRQIEALIDPFPLDLQPLLEIIGDKSITKIVHAGGQDLSIFFQVFGTAAHHIFDTQIAAAFLGYGHQIGYADLVRRLIGGPPLSKEMQYTDWSSRPLSAAQMEYALADVRYLPEMYAMLRRDLVARGRLEWAKAELRRAETKAREPLALEELYRKFNLSGLSRRRLGSLREIAMVRELLARAIDKPPSFIVSDPVLLQMAKQPPATVGELRAQRGMPSLSAEHAEKFIAALERAEKLANDELPERNVSERPDPRTDTVISMLGVVAQMRAVDHDISRTYLASRDQLAALAAWWLRGDPEPPQISLLDDWRKELLGGELLDLLNGRLALTLNPAARSTPDDPPIQVVEIDEADSD